MKCVCGILTSWRNKPTVHEIKTLIVRDENTGLIERHVIKRNTKNKDADLRKELRRVSKYKDKDIKFSERLSKHMRHKK